MMPNRTLESCDRCGQADRAEITTIHIDSEPRRICGVCAAQLRAWWYQGRLATS